MWSREHDDCPVGGSAQFEERSSDSVDAEIRRTDPHDIAKTLEEAFSVVSSPENKWARDFVLDTSPETNIQVISNPAALPYASTLSFSDICFQADEVNGGSFDYRLEVDVLFIPSFCSGSLSVGAVVSRSLTGPIFDSKISTQAQSSLDDTPPTKHSNPRQPMQDSAYSYRIGRYARDEPTGKMLAILHSHSSQTYLPMQTQIISLEHVSSTQNKRVVVSCDTETFLAGQLAKSVTLCMIKLFTRDCAMCGAPVKSRCGCRVRTSCPAHPLDFRCAVPAVKLQSGELSASANKAKVYALQVDNVSPSLLLINSLKPSDKNWLQKYNRDFSWQNDPSHRNFITLPVVTRSRIQCDSFSRSSDVRDSRFSCVFGSLQQFALQFSLSRAHPMQISGASFVDGSTVDPVTANSGGLLHMGVFGDFTRPACTSASVCGDSNLLEGDGVKDATAPKEIHGNHTHVGSNGRGSESSQGTSDPPENQTLTASTKVSVGEPSGSAIEVDCIQSNPGASSSAISVPSGDERPLNRYTIRRLKNRASAARSNAKRKALNEQLRQNLDQSRARLKELQERRAVLLEENFELRSQLQNSPFFVGFFANLHR